VNNVLCKCFVQARVITDGPNLFCLFSVFEEPEDPSNRSFFSEIITSNVDNSRKKKLSLKQIGSFTF